MKKIILSLILISIFSVNLVYPLSVQDLFRGMSNFFQSFFAQTTSDNTLINPNQGVGQCHWINPEVISRDYISWAYDAGDDSRWSTIQPSENEFNFNPLDQEIAKATDAGKKVWIEILTTEGSVPQWAKDKGVQTVDVRGGQPVSWNPTYKILLRKVVHKMAEKYDDDSTVEAIIISAGGCYGEMTLCGTSIEKTRWEDAGYTDEVFVQTVKDIIDIYLEQEYTWPDGTKTHGFLKKPVVLQLGSGLYGHTRIVMEPVIDYAIPKYGMRVWLKYNGWGNGYEPSWAFSKYNTQTRVGYEPAGNIAGFPSDNHFSKVLEDKSSYVCFQEVYLNDQSLILKIKNLTQKIGSQIIIEDFNYPSTADAGKDIQLTFKWKNVGIASLMRPKREGLKDNVASYDMFVDLVNSSDQTVLHKTFTPSTPTHQWTKNQEVVETKTLNVPLTIHQGQYSVRIGLINPDNENEKINLITTKPKDNSNRYNMGLINIGSTQTTTTTITGTTSTSITTTSTTTSITSTVRTTTTTSTARVTTTTVIQCSNFLTCNECITHGCGWCQNPSVGSSGCRKTCSWENCFQGTCFDTSCGVTITTSTTTIPIPTTISTTTTQTIVTTTLTLVTTTTIEISTTTSSTTTVTIPTTTTTVKPQGSSKNIQTIVAILGAIGVSATIILLL